MDRGSVVMIGLVLMAAGAGIVDAREQPIEQLPKDVVDLAFVWTEPLKEVAKQTRQLDPVRGLWFGLLEGSVKSVQRTARFFLSPDKERPSPEPGKLLKYSF